ncbi:glutathione synthase [Aquisalimonas lutea]|uniref:glutathione synthase n=1 Tax=Aquisalimonas lutea TaxID=1327750 RepID=UPI0025B3C94D|nr:glutathione synthase [Aquisalimonas lutea]MDN3516105.1 glutathione synthase [Aquisalimonas lutea]
MSVRLGVVMDPIDHIKPWKDTTFALLLAAQARGWELHYLELGDLFLRDGEAWGHTRPVTVRDRRTDWYELGPGASLPLGDLDIILMRKDPPVDAAFTYATHLLERAEAAGARVVNRPAALRDANEKLFTAHFPECCAPTLVDSAPQRLRAFISEQGKAVLKPLDGMGGRSIFVVADGDPNTSVIIDTLTEGGSQYIMAQRYLPEIRDGDKRILVIDGEPVATALARFPAAGETRGNLAAGGRGESVPLSERDRWICRQVAPALVARGLRFVGLDVIGEFLTEINVTSPTCVRELDALNGSDIGGDLLDRLAADP